jgi:5-deoxy-D-glucuronate isomerase
VLVLAQNGLHDPKLRQKMNPEERQTYLEILNSADVQKIDRGEWKSVRLVLEITPQFLDMARLASIAAPAEQTSTPPEFHGKTTAPAKTRTAGKK